MSIDRRISHALLRNLSVIADDWFARHFDRALLNAWKIYGTEAAELAWLKDRFIDPLLRLLAEYIASGDEKYLALYLDERLRYAPHRLSKSDRVAFFGQLVPADEQALLGLFGPDSQETTRLRTILAKAHQSLLELPSAKPLEVLALGDCLLNEVRIFVGQKCRTRGFEADMRCMYFSATENAELSTQGVIPYLQENRIDAIAISFFTFDGMRSFSRLMQEYPRLGETDIQMRIERIMQSVREFLVQLREHTQAPFMVHDACGLPLTRVRKHLPVIPALPAGKRAILDRINTALEDIIRHVPNCLRIEEKAIAERQGLHAMAHDIVPRRLRKHAFFHTSVFGEKLAEAYSEVLEALTRLGKAKVVLVDFDNTLWEGVMADGPVRQFHERQQLLRELKEAGVLLVALTKNSPENIRWSEMTLKPEDFVLRKISWNLKPQSVQEAAAELNLGVDSFVVVDDNPVERDLVTQAHPKLQVLDATDDRTWSNLKRMLQFPNTQSTDEARTRTAMYQAQVQRQAALRMEFDYPQMMATLDLRMTFRRAAGADSARLFELINRTNQFNTTTVRFSKAEIKSLLADPAHQIWVTDLADKFGKLGLIGTVIVQHTGDRRSVIESFVMSCRAMGYRVEQQMLVEVAKAQPEGISSLVGRYIETDRNAPCRDVFKSCGFKQLSETDWTYEIGQDSALQPVPWIAVADR